MKPGQNGSAAVPVFWAAADLAKVGYPVFPLKGKHPSVEGGFYAATTDASQVAEWVMEGREHHDVAFATGLPSGVVVVDADTPEAAAEMEDEYGPPTVRTNRGGHWYFRHPQTGKMTSTTIRPGLDRKGDGGYVAAPPSRGRVWTNGIPDRATLPELPEALRPKRSRAENSDAARTLPQDLKESAAEAIAGRVARIPQGKRHEHLRHLCGVLLSRGVAVGDAEDVLTAAWAKVGGELAERAEREIPNTLATTEQALAEDRATGVPSLEKITPGLYTELETVFGWRAEMKVSSLSSPYIGSDSDDTKRPPLRAVPFSDMGEPTQHKEILAGLVPEKYPAVWYGGGGSAKSMLALSFGVAVAGDARTWLGRAVSKTPVLYADFELDEDEQNRRVRRIVKGAGLAQPPDDLLYLPALGYGPVEALRASYAECKCRGVKLLILDSFGPAMQGDSEAARDIIGFFGKVMEPFRALGVAVLIIDHQARTQAGERYQSKSAFGSVYKTNLTRSVVQIEATERGEDYVALRLRHKKHNFGPLADPFAARITFGDSVVVEAEELDEADLAEEGTLNAADRVKHALQPGPAYPEELAERTGLALGTVKNALTKLRKAGVVKSTGERRGQAEQVELVSSPSFPIRDSDSDDTRKPLSADLEPGESGWLPDLADRRDVEAAGEQMRRAKSGPALALSTYLQKPNAERLEWLTKAVLTAQGMDTAHWQACAAAVKAAAEDPTNHPPECLRECCLAV